MSPRATVWRCGRFELSLGRPLVMGILNVTPDSFSDGGDHEDPAAAVAWGERLVSQGADVLDIGGESTRPGSELVFPAEELSRVRPVVMRMAHADLPISIDTRHADVARGCIEVGASIVNDVSGFLDPEMVGLVAHSDVGVVVMHMLGEPRTMQAKPRYDDVAAEVGGFLLAQAALLEASGVERERIAIDPGIGFGKTLEHNLALLRSLPELSGHGYPVLVGVSRKRFIGELSGEEEPKLRLGGSIAAAIEATRLGANIVRVHDVLETVQAMNVANAIRRDND
ncbi:MAG TPA: dihydropteroate synthase [Coriobacteriia bacterium]|nr:dihydropteroate synthase [Coriobacteriia bacterium]